MKPFPSTWNAAQRERFAQMETFLGIQGLYDRLECVHVTGTNGKGSVCAYVASMLEQAGYTTGLFISPHLYEENERIQINGLPIPMHLLRQWMEQAYTRLPKARVFEAYFYAALRWFAQENVDIAVIEAGIGGAMDCTTILSPRVTVCTKIGVDHAELLGRDIADIARQKAGIAKPGVPMVLYPVQDERAQVAFWQESNRRGALPVDLTKAYAQEKDTPQGPCWRLHVPHLTLEDVRLPLLGGYQAQNALTALAVMQTLKERDGYFMTNRALKDGLEQTRWPGRLERLPLEPPVLLDGAHNPQAARALVQSVKTLYPDTPLVLLTAVMADKDAQGIAKELAALSDTIICTQVKSERALDARAYAALYPLAHAEPNAKQAYVKACSLCPPQGMVVLAGSLYLPSAVGLGLEAAPKPLVRSARPPQPNF